MEFILYILIGALAGCFSGLLGIGGGLLIVPALSWVFLDYGMPHEAIMHLAVGTSLAVMVVSSLTSVRAHYRLGNVLWPVLKSLLPAIIIGTLLGIAIAALMHSHALSILFGIILIIVALQMFIGKTPKPTRGLPGPVGMFGAGIAIGGQSGLLGIGGSAFTIPFLHYCNVPMRQVVGTTAACSLVGAVIGTIGEAFVGWHHTAPVAGVTGYVYWVAFAFVSAGSFFFVPVGVWLSQHLPVGILKKVFAILLFFVAIRMLVVGF